MVAFVIATFLYSLLRKTKFLLLCSFCTFFIYNFTLFIFLLYFIFAFVDRVLLDGKCIVTRKRYADTPFSVSGLSSRRASGYSTSVEAHKAMCLLSMLHAVHTPALWLRRCVCVCVCVCVCDLFSHWESFNFAEESHFSAFKECIPVGMVQHFCFCTNYTFLLSRTNLVSFSRYFSFNSYVRHIYIGYMMHF